MFAFSEFTASFAPTLLVLGIGLLVLPLFRPTAQPVRALAFVGVALLAWRYIAWRFSETIPAFDYTFEALASWLFGLLEAGTIVSGSISFLILSRTLDRRAEADANVGWWAGSRVPQVDILIATYNEEQPILERTIVGALSTSHPKIRVWVLDDGRRQWLRELCDRLGVRHVTRADGTHAKAGNINAALPMLRALPEPPDFVAVLDADFVPHVDFVTRMLALFHDPAVGLVQSPQHFFNTDPIQHNLGIGRAYPDEQRFFFDHIQPARDAWTIAFCCGTSAMIRWQALETIGGFPTESVTEDFLVTLRLREVGLKTVYLNEALTEGLAPEGLAEYITQRGRWCLGLMQIVRGRLGPFSRNRLRPIDRLGLVDALLYWSTTYAFRFACLIVPVLYWYFGITVVNAPVPGIVGYFGPFYVGSLLVLNWISGGLVLPILNDVSQILGAKEIMKSLVVGLVKPGGHKFKVTAKGGDRNRSVVQWSLIRPFGGLFLLTLGGVFFAGATGIQFDTDAGDGRWIVLFWTVYNLAVLAVAMSVCVEIPRSTTNPQIVPERVTVRVGTVTTPAWIMRLTPDDAWIRGGPVVRSGDSVRLEIDGVGEIACQVLRIEPSGCAVGLEPDTQQRLRILAKLHTQIGRHGTLRSEARNLIVGVIWRLIRGH